MRDWCGLPVWLRTCLGLDLVTGLFTRFGQADTPDTAEHCSSRKVSKNDCSTPILRRCNRRCVLRTRRQKCGHWYAEEHASVHPPLGRAVYVVQRLQQFLLIFSQNLAAAVDCSQFYSAIHLE